MTDWINKDHWDKKNRVATKPEDLNPLVAKYVMDLRMTLCGGGCYVDGLASSSQPIPNYAAGESIWDVVEKCLDEGIQLLLHPNKNEYYVSVEPFKPRERRNGAWSKASKISVCGSTAPIAYCLAALWAVGVEVECRPERELPKVGEVWDYVDNGEVKVLMIEPANAAFPLGGVVCRAYPRYAGGEERIWLVTTERFLDCARRLYNPSKEV